MNDICCFTIITSDYLPQAYVLADSLLKSISHEASILNKDNNKTNHEAFTDVSVNIFILGSKKEIISYSNEINICHVEEIINSDTIELIVSNYTPSESCWALKPIIMQWLQTQYQTIYYFDSDIYFLGSFSTLASELAQSEILLTPHYLNIFPDDDKSPSDLTLLRAGVFNAGFLGIRCTKNTNHFLSWWKNKVIMFGRNDPDNGMCGDQKWLDLVPVLFSGVKICRHPGFNVAYWNLHERYLKVTNNTIYCAGRELVFFHFSGFKKDDISNISRHQDRITMDDVILQLVSEYADKLSRTASRCKLNRSDYYQYSKWWHSHVKLYRFISDILINPRKSPVRCEK